MFEVHCDELIRALTKRAEGLRSRLLAKMCEDHQKENKKYVIARLKFVILIITLKSTSLLL